LLLARPGQLLLPTAPQALLLLAVPGQALAKEHEGGYPQARSPVRLPGSRCGEGHLLFSERVSAYRYAALGGRSKEGVTDYINRLLLQCEYWME